MISDLNKNTVVLKEIPHRILMQNVNVNIDSVSQNGCVNIGSQVVPNDKELCKNSIENKVKDVTNEKENVLNDKKKRNDKSNDISLEDEDNQREKNQGKDDFF